MRLGRTGNYRRRKAGKRERRLRQKKAHPGRGLYPANPKSLTGRLSAENKMLPAIRRILPVIHRMFPMGRRTLPMGHRTMGRRIFHMAHRIARTVHRIHLMARRTPNTGRRTFLPTDSRDSRMCRPTARRTAPTGCPGHRTAPTAHPMGKREGTRDRSRLIPLTALIPAVPRNGITDGPWRRLSLQL